MAVVHQSHPAARENMVDILLRRAKDHADRTAFHFTPDLTSEWTAITYDELLQLASGFAAMLQERGLEGERVLLMARSNFMFVVAFYACLMAGAVAVPTAPPRRELLMNRMHTIADNAEIRAGIADSGDIMQAALGVRHTDLEWFDIRAIVKSGQLSQYSDKRRPPKIAADDMALIQYTSGSTGNPKGVVISHANLTANAEAIRQAFGLNSSSRVLLALPLSHDMGLVGGVVVPVYTGTEIFLMTPAQFVQKPAGMLRLISSKKVTTCGGPNFLYELCTSIPPEHLEGIDLSSWELAFCGAEPIRKSTVAKFLEKFSAYGFRPEAFYACYGMAEATLFVTGQTRTTVPHFDEENLHSKPRVSCGRPAHKTEVVIVDPETARPVTEGSEGEIWVRGTSIAQGYWRNPEATAEMFHARLADSVQRPYVRSYLRTGDLGYMKRGELFVTGRLKDLIILNGRNHAPQDLELTAETSHEGLSPASGAAFMVPIGDREQLVIACEIKRAYRRRWSDWKLITEAVRNEVLRKHGVAVRDVVLLHPGTLPRTSSGKVRRRQCQEDYQSGRLEQATQAAC